MTLGIGDAEGLNEQQIVEIFGQPDTKKLVQDNRLEYEWSHSTREVYKPYESASYNYLYKGGPPPKAKPFFKEIGHDIVDSATLSHDPDPGQEIHGDCVLTIQFSNNKAVYVDTDSTDNFLNLRDDTNACDFYLDKFQDYYRHHDYTLPSQTG